MNPRMHDNIDWSHEICATGRVVFGFRGELPVQPRVPDRQRRSTSHSREYTTDFEITEDGDLCVQRFHFPTADPPVPPQVVDLYVDGAGALFLAHFERGPVVTVPFLQGRIAPENEWTVADPVLRGTLLRELSAGYLVDIGVLAFLPRSQASPETRALGDRLENTLIECEVVFVGRERENRTTIVVSERLGGVRANGDGRDRIRE